MSTQIRDAQCEVKRGEDRLERRKKEKMKKEREKRVMSSVKPRYFKMDDVSYLLRILH